MVRQVPASVWEAYEQVFSKVKERLGRTEEFRAVLRCIERNDYRSAITILRLWSTCLLHEKLDEEARLVCRLYDLMAWIFC